MSVRLYYPYGGPTIGLTLSNPVFGNIEDLNIQVITKHSRNGDLYSFNRIPTYQILKFEFDKIKHSELETIKSFLRLSAAEYIRLIDHTSRAWKGIIITPTPIFTNHSRSLCTDLYNLSFDFEGTLL